MNAYFLRPEVSNSELLALRRAYYSVPDPDLEQVYRFGSLVDAMLTEDGRVDYILHQLHDDDEIINYTGAEFVLATSMVDACKVDPVIRAFIEGGRSQHIFIKTIGFTYDGEEYQIKGRCKFDSIKKSIKTGADYKTTACTTRKACLAAIDYFNYDQQGAWYMDLAGTDRHWIIFISKKTKQVFKFAIERGDAVYEQGRRKYSFWARVWLMLFENFMIPETI